MSDLFNVNKECKEKKRKMLMGVDVSSEEEETNSSSESPDEEICNVTVTVIDKKTNDAVVNADVAIYDKGEPYEATTDNKGECTISNIPYGTYTIEAVAEGYDFTVLNNVTINVSELSVELELVEEE